MPRMTYAQLRAVDWNEAVRDALSVIASAQNPDGTPFDDPTTPSFVDVVELPDAQVLSDGLANPTTTMIGSALLVWDSTGSQWARVKADRDNVDNMASIGTRQIPRMIASQFVYNGATYDRFRTPTMFKVLNAINVGGGESTLWTPAAGKKFRLMGYVFTVTAAGLLTLRDNTAGTIIGVYGLAANIPFASPEMGNGQISAAANNVLTGQLSVAGTVSGIVFGTEE